MPRPAISDMKVVFRIDSKLHTWFKDYCQRNSTTMSEMYRKWLFSLKHKEERAQRKAQQRS